MMTILHKMNYVVVLNIQSRCSLRIDSTYSLFQQFAQQPTVQYPPLRLLFTSHKLFCYTI